MNYCNCLLCRRERAQQLIDTLNEDAGKGLVVAGFAQIIIFSKANDVIQLELPFCGRQHVNSY